MVPSVDLVRLDAYEEGQSPLFCRAVEDHSSQLDGVGERFEAWRKRRKQGGRIPEELWKGAVGLAGSLGVSKTAQGLRAYSCDFGHRFRTKSDGCSD